MSQENVELVRRVHAEWAKGNFSTDHAFDPGVRVVWADWMLAQRAESVGLHDTALAMGEFLDAYDRLTARADEIIDAGDNVVVLSTWLGRGRASGVEFSQRLGTVWTLSDGRVSRLAHYRDPAEALKAAGLSE